jgi:uncharacterized UPF0160 family protein
LFKAKSIHSLHVIVDVGSRYDRNSKKIWGHQTGVTEKDEHQSACLKLIAH